MLEFQITQKGGMNPAMSRARVSTDQRAIGERLQLLRRAKANSQAEFCRMMGFAQPTWNMYETGRSRINLDAAIRLQSRFGAPLGWIYLGEMDGLKEGLARELYPERYPEMNGDNHPGQRRRA
jgi:transcriptional regulator with XRE-family HTH domain